MKFKLLLVYFYLDHLIKIIHNDVHIAEDHLKHNILEEFEK